MNWLIMLVNFGMLGLVVHDYLHIQHLEHHIGTLKEAVIILLKAEKKRKSANIQDDLTEMLAKAAQRHDEARRKMESK